MCFLSNNSELTTNWVMLRFLNSIKKINSKNLNVVFEANKNSNKIHQK